jgi:hypothetical protein
MVVPHTERILSPYIVATDQTMAKDPSDMTGFPGTNAKPSELQEQQATGDINQLVLVRYYSAEKLTTQVRKEKRKKKKV